MASKTIGKTRAVGMLSRLQIERNKLIKKIACCFLMEAIGVGLMVWRFGYLTSITYSWSGAMLGRRLPPGVAIDYRMLDFIGLLAYAIDIAIAALRIFAPRFPLFVSRSTGPWLILFSHYVNGLALGWLCILAEITMPGLVAQALLATVSTVGAILLVHKKRLVIVTTKFRRRMYIALLAILLLFELDFALISFDIISIPLGPASRWWGLLMVLVSLAAIMLAAFVFLDRLQNFEREVRDPNSDLVDKWHGYPPGKWRFASSLVTSIPEIFCMAINFFMKLRQQRVSKRP